MKAPADHAGSGSYYGRPVIKPPIWKPEIGWYFFTGGLAGASSTLALAARLSRNGALARTATLVGTAAVCASPPLLIKDLGRPERFHHMLRVFKPTSPMNLGSWVLAAAGASQSVAGTCELLHVLPRLKGACQAVAGLSGPVLSTYTAVLLADTAVPVWHEARRELPMVFAAGAVSSAGAAATLAARSGSRGPARRLAVLGAVLELAAADRMERRLGYLAGPYREGVAGRRAKAAKLCLAAGSGMLMLARGRRLPSRIGATAVLAGGILERFAVLRAGTESALDPRYTVGQQRERLAPRRSGTA